MKRIISFILLIFTIFSFSACGENVNMEKLTAYQNGDFCAEAKVTIDGMEYAANIEKQGGKLKLVFTKPSELSDFTFILSESGASIATDDLEIPVEGSELLKFAKLYPLFSVSAAGTWKIKKSRPGGVHVYVCESENIVLYIDAGSRLPLKLVTSEAEVDILSFKVK